MGWLVWVRILSVSCRCFASLFLSLSLSHSSFNSVGCLDIFSLLLLLLIIIFVFFSLLDPCAMYEIRFQLYIILLRVSCARPYSPHSSHFLCQSTTIKQKKIKIKIIILLLICVLNLWLSAFILKAIFCVRVVLQSLVWRIDVVITSFEKRRKTLGYVYSLVVYWLINFEVCLIVSRT